MGHKHNKSNKFKNKSNTKMISTANTSNNISQSNNKKSTKTMKEILESLSKERSVVAEPVDVKSVLCAKDVCYIIPSYQRGYRWGDDQVTDLIKDLTAFIGNPQNGKDDYYCLQSLILKKQPEETEIEGVVVEEGHNSINCLVVDGQQRLTTLFLLLVYLRNTHNASYDLCNIQYSTRKESKTFLKILTELNRDNYKAFISKLTKNSEDDNSVEDNYDDCFKKLTDNISINRDIWHMINTCRVLFECDKNNGVKNNGIKYDFDAIKELIDDNRVKYILQLCGSKENEIEAFENLNVGQTPLTSAELIRAKIIHGETEDKTEIAKEWDEIEHTLQDDSVWYFIQRENNLTASRIGVLFEIIAYGMIKENNSKKSSLNGTDVNEQQKDKKINNNEQNVIELQFDDIINYDEIIKSEKNNEHGLYRFYEHYTISRGKTGIIVKEGDTFSDASIKEFWKEVKNLFNVLMKWYGDIKIYNYIGQLFCDKENRNVTDKIWTYYNVYISEKSDRDEFIRFLKRLILDSFGDINRIWPESYSDGKKPYGVKIYAKSTQEKEDDSINSYLEKMGFEITKVKTKSGKKNKTNYISDDNICKFGLDDEIFKKLWYSGREEENKYLQEDREGLVNFLVWTNCEFLNEQMERQIDEIKKDNKDKTAEKSEETLDRSNEDQWIELERYRFPFNIYKTSDTDVEHVDSFMDKIEEEKFWSVNNGKERKKYFENLIRINPAEIEMIIGGLEDELEKEKKTNNIDLQKIMIQRIFDYNNAEETGIKKDNNFDENTKGADRRKIGNLTLLDSTTNRGYRNTPYRYKRLSVIKREQAGEYIYPCTRMVFLKEFPSGISTDDNNSRWTKNDFENYKDFLGNLFYKCFCMEYNENSNSLIEYVYKKQKDEKQEQGNKNKKK